MEDETHPSEVVVDRSVHFIDEVVEEIERAGAPALDDTLDEILAGIQASCSGSSSDLEDAEQAAIHAEVLRYGREVEEPAAEVVRNRRAFGPSAVRKVVMPFTDDGSDAAARVRREVLDGAEPVIQVAAPPPLTLLVLRVSWPRDSALRYHGGQSFVSSSDGNLLALYVGGYRPGLGPHYPGCYLIYDAWASSVAAIPRLPSCFLSSMHLSVGGGVAVLRHREPSDYVLAELLRLRSDDDDDDVCCGGGRAATYKADLFLWWSSGACAGRWTQKPVQLPLRFEPGIDTHFHADMVQAAGRTRLCWIDLFQGALICDDVLSDRPRFRQIALPKECFVKQGHMDRMHPELSRSACCVERGDGRWTLEFLAMDSHGRGLDCPLRDQPCQKCRRKGGRDCPCEDRPQDCPLHSWTLTTWSMILQDPCEQLQQQEQLEWEKGSSVCLAEVIKDPDLQAMQPQVPVLSMAEEGVVYLVLSDFSCPEITACLRST
ncbi:hypothetical protein ACP4OV_005407 [Aristida adscensionis]